MVTDSCCPGPDLRDHGNKDMNESTASKEWARELVLYTWIIIVVRVETRSGNKPTNYYNTNNKPYAYIYLFIYSVLQDKRER